VIFRLRLEGYITVLWIL